MILELNAQRTGQDQMPGFGARHVGDLLKEAAQLKRGGAPLIALAHGCNRRDGGWSQHSTLFLSFLPEHDMSVRLTIKVGSTTLFEGEAMLGDLHWIYINWDRHPGDLILQINDTVGVLTAAQILQTTDMTCIIRHPPVPLQKIEADIALTAA